MKWEKKGLIFKAEGQSEIMQSHTTPINAIVLEDRIRVFFSSRSKRDKEGNYISYPTYVDLDLDQPQKILHLHDQPLLSTGEPGTFDEFGIMIYKSMMYRGRLYMYYGGWQRLASKKAPYQVLLGLAVSSDAGKTFKKYSTGPVMGIDIYDPISIGNVYPFIKEDTIYLFYTSYSHWDYCGKKATPEYDIKIAISSDGVTWDKDNIIAIAQNEKGGVATPTIFEYEDKYIMLFGYRKTFDDTGRQMGYSLGYAESTDLIHWKRRDDEAGLTTSEIGWDSEMVCYPDVVKVKDKYLMFYCGNGYGASGFGYAELIE